jgi:hypothetical protein
MDDPTPDSSSAPLTRENRTLKIGARLASVSRALRHPLWGEPPRTAAAAARR